MAHGTKANVNVDVVQETLALLRQRRNFDAKRYVQAKTDLLCRYLGESGISTCVIGVSGGVDSAVTLGLVAHAARAPGSPIKRIIPALLPIESEGATNQQVATSRGRQAAEHFGLIPVEIPLATAFQSARESVETGMDKKGGGWAAGQLVSYLRTPVLYYLATLATEEGNPAVVVGTTNRDEGAYIGFFGKASDGMVDLQLISDLHKSEVYKVAAVLGVPAEIVNAVPRGDTFDGRNDEQMIGVPYDVLELVELLRTPVGSDLGPKEDQDDDAPAWPTFMREQLAAWTTTVDALHLKNGHKYLGQSPAVHLDVYERPIPPLWQSPPRGAHDLPANANRFTGLFSLDDVDDELVEGIANATKTRPAVASATRFGDFGDSALLVGDVLLDQEADDLASAFMKVPQVPVGKHGRPDDTNATWSFRASAFSPRLASTLWHRLSGSIPAVRTFDEYAATDWDNHPIWRAVGLNPLFRFIRYSVGGGLVPHYDSTYELEDGRSRTLMSVVFFLNDGQSNGASATRLLLDPERNFPLAERNFSDWETRPVPARDVLHLIAPRRGNVLVFDHRILHDVEPSNVGPGDALPRIVMRTDIVFERCGTPAIGRAFPRSRNPHPRSDEPARAKVETDPYYRSAYEALGTHEAIVQAGYFEDAQPPHKDVRASADWMVTPVFKITRRLEAHEVRAEQGDFLAVLVTTGGFCPIHQGHVQMMEAARAELERQGGVVLGGYLSPSHDAYIREKCGPEAPDAAHRIFLCERAVEASDWLMVDPWEALHTSSAVNFTAVLCHLERYLARHVRTHRPIRVYYVFGSDNARFSLAFVRRGHSVCVPRPGFEAELEQFSKRLEVVGNRRIVFASTPAPDASSERVRAGDVSCLDERTARIWQRFYEKALSSTSVPSGHRRGRLYVRDEGDWPVEPWMFVSPSIKTAWPIFQQRVIENLDAAFSTASHFDDVHGIEIIRLTLLEQRAVARGATEGAFVVSLDPCLPGDLDLGISRCFPVAGDGQAPKMVSRPSWPSLDDQCRHIPPGRVVLLDDDISTGATLAYVRSLLPQAVTVDRVVTLCDLKREGEVMVDLVDSRDFLAGGREAGLAIELPNGEVVRAPYCLPYARPSARIGIPLANELVFSRAVWRLNAELFEALVPALTVKQASSAFQRLCLYLGFTQETPLATVCRFHEARLGGPSSAPDVEAET